MRSIGRRSSRSGRGGRCRSRCIALTSVLRASERPQVVVRPFPSVPRGRACRVLPLTRERPTARAQGADRSESRRASRRGLAGPHRGRRAGQYIGAAAASATRWPTAADPSAARSPAHLRTTVTGHVACRTLLSPTDPSSVLTASPCPRFPTTSRSAPRDCSRRTGAVLPERTRTSTRYGRERAPLPDDLVDHLPRLFLQVGLDLGGHPLRRHAPLSDPVLDRREDPDGPQYRTSACRVLQREPQCRAGSRASVHAHDHRCPPVHGHPPCSSGLRGAVVPTTDAPPVDGVHATGERPGGSGPVVRPRRRGSNGPRGPVDCPCPMHPGRCHRRARTWGKDLR